MRLEILAAQRSEAVSMMVGAKMAQANAEERIRQVGHWRGAGGGLGGGCGGAGGTLEGGRGGAAGGQGVWGAGGTLEGDMPGARVWGAGGTLEGGRGGLPGARVWGTGGTLEGGCRGGGRTGVKSGGWGCRVGHWGTYALMYVTSLVPLVFLCTCDCPAAALPCPALLLPCPALTSALLRVSWRTAWQTWMPLRGCWAQGRAAAGAGGTAMQHRTLARQGRGRLPLQGQGPGEQGCPAAGGPPRRAG